jgi:DNA-directed RNA polymerase subunit omega
MARTTHDTMMEPPVENLLGHVDSKFRLVTLAARRARQINSYFNHLGDSMGAMVPPQVTSVARKPLSIAFEEIAADKIEFVPIEPGDELLAVVSTDGAEVLVEAKPVDGGSGE